MCGGGKAFLMRKRTMVAGAVAIMLAAVGTAVFVARDAAHRAPVQGRVTARLGGTVTLGDASLSAPPGTVSGTGRLVAISRGAPSLSGPTAAGMALAGGAVPTHFRVRGAHITGSLVVTFRVGSRMLPHGLSP